MDIDIKLGRGDGRARKTGRASWCDVETHPAPKRWAKIGRPSGT